MHVFSCASGELLRTIRGSWMTPWAIRHMGGRLYMIEDAFTEVVEKGDSASVVRAKRSAGRCVRVLSLDGQLLQVHSCAPTAHSDGPSGSSSRWNSKPAAADGPAGLATEDAEPVYVHMCAVEGRLMCVLAQENPSRVVLQEFIHQAQDQLNH